MGPELFDDRLELLQGPTEGNRGGKLVVTVQEIDAHHRVPAVRLGLDLLDELHGQLTGAENEDAFHEEAAAEDRIGERAERQEKTDDDDEARDEEPSRDPGIWNERIEDGDEDEGDAQGAHQPGCEVGERSRDAKIVEIVVVERDDAAKGEAEGLTQDDEDIA